jgi:predicted metal-dependent HD superfamily phosphohydrolase
MSDTAAAHLDEELGLLSQSRWRRACAALGAANADSEHRKLTRAWRSWGRRYHTLEHLAACLRELECSRELAQRPFEVELALWFHDAVYRTYRSDNELRSAEWAARFLVRHGASAESASRVRDLVMATAHAPGALEGDRALIVDVDLSILGQPEAVYDEFERNVRREYWWVSRRRFIEGRRRILQSFVARPFIYHWPCFRERYEARARANIGRALGALNSA